jgi:energy-converting hydrogenase Eha subunit C
LRRAEARNPNISPLKAFFAIVLAKFEFVALRKSFQVMQNQNFQSPNIDVQYQTLLTIWPALFISILLLLGLVFFIKGNELKDGFDQDNFVLLIALAAVGCVTFVLSFIVKKAQLNQAISKKQTALVQSGLIVALAACEATCLFGAVAAFVTNTKYFFLWFILGAIGYILHFPRKKHLLDAVYGK